jgi:hypothetical protein
MEILLDVDTVKQDYKFISFSSQLLQRAQHIALYVVG